MLVYTVNESKWGIIILNEAIQGNKILIDLFATLFAWLFAGTEQENSRLRASSPCLEPEKELPCLGEAIPALIFTENTVQISFVRPPTRTSQGVGSRSIYLAIPGVDPDRLRLRRCLGLRPIQRCPCGLPRYAMVARCGVTLCCRLATRDCNSLAPEAVGLYEPDTLRRRHLFLDFICRRRWKRKPPPAAVVI